VSARAFAYIEMAAYEAALSILWADIGEVARIHPEELSTFCDEFKHRKGR
jgi:hypothetical protein